MAACGLGKRTASLIVTIIMPKVPDSSVEELMEIVREHPSIYDVTDPNHMEGNVSRNICVHVQTCCVYRIYVKQLLAALYTQVWL